MENHVCPWWMGYVLANPLRRFIHNPEKILSPHITPGMKVLDLGCAMGFFSLPLAKMVAPEGKVLSLDIQPKMLKVLNRRALKAGLAGIIDSRICGPDHLGAEDMLGKINFVLAFYMVHEVKESRSLLEQVHALLASKGRFLILEPKHHVTRSEFQKTEAAAQQAGFKTIGHPNVRGSRTLLMEKD